jgi:hypothetical protein
VLATGLALAAGPSAEAIFASVKKGFAGVNDYRADLTLSVKGPNMSINDMRMTLYFKKPNKVHVEAAQGMAMVPPGSFLGNPTGELATGAQPVYLRSQRKLGRDCDVLKLVNPKAGAKAPAVLVWIDKERKVMVAMETSGELAVKTAWRYQKIDGKYYLPAEITADMKMPRGPQAGQSSKAVIKFTNYRVNKGISDKIFERKPGK